MDNKSSSGSRKSGTTTSSSSAVVRARARAEAAKARIAFAEKEAEIKIAQAKLEAELGTLTVKREAAAAEAEAEVLEAAEEGDYVSTTGRDRQSVPVQDIAERTSDYVEEQNKLHSSHASIPSPPGSDDSLVTWGTPVHDSPPKPSTSKEDSKPPVTQTKPVESTHLPKKDNTETLPMKKEHKMDTRTPQNTLNPAAQSYIPQQSAAARPDIPQPFTARLDIPQQSIAWSSVPQHAQMYNTAAVTNDLARYLARRDLVSTSLFQFDDKPENYRAWHSSFNNAVRGIGLTASEEMDLLTKWLGRESSEHVKRMRSVHVSDPEEALRKAWRRLQDCYAAPEVIEDSLFKKLDDFPKISAKEYTKLRELGDLLMEIQCAKAEGYLQGLKYLDTARGIHPIIEKLPHSLQEKWVTYGSRFKDNEGQFPPFDVFAGFIYDEARIRNDPSFIFPSSSSTFVPGKPERTKSSGTRNPIVVHKTNVAAVEDSDEDTPTRKNDGPGKNCPLHNNKPHPLRKCKVFRAKSLEERKAFLKENGICFKCCASTTHMARDCDATVKCTVCDSTRHNTAMHADPIPRRTPPSKDGGEEEEQGVSTSEVNSYCTKVCGVGQAARSCSKICLVRVYPQGQRDKAINTYVILDDQSNRSLARTNFFELFEIQSQPSSYSLQTCAGTIDTSGRRAEGFQIESLDGKVGLVLPTLIECNEIPNNRLEIPTPDAARHHPHLRSVAANIPELDTSAEILLLLGRDIVRVHKVRQQVNGPHDAPFAQRLDLGWVLVGDVCLGNAHKPAVSTFKTNVLENGRPTILTPRKSILRLKERVCDDGGERHGNLSKPRTVTEHSLGATVFNRTNEDNNPGPSIEDSIQMVSMDSEIMHMAGTQSDCDCKNNANCDCYQTGDGYAQDAGLNALSSLVAGPDGTPCVEDLGNSCIQTISRNGPTVTTSQSSPQHEVASSDTQELYMFDVNGTHRHTSSLLTEHFKYMFGYSAENDVKAVTDSSGKILHICRDTNRMPVCIVAPDNQVIWMSMGTNGGLKTLTAQRQVLLTYHGNNGLLATKTSEMPVNVSRSSKQISARQRGPTTERVEYDTQGWLVSRVFADGKMWSYTYLEKSRVLLLDNLRQYIYKYRQQNKPPEILYDSMRASFTYDETAGVLKTVNLQNDGFIYSFRYRQIGTLVDRQIFCFSEDGIVNARFDYTYDSSLRVTTVQGVINENLLRYNLWDRITRLADVQYQLDENRFLQQCGAKIFQYNSKGLLVRVYSKRQGSYPERVAHGCGHFCLRWKRWKSPQSGG